MATTLSPWLRTTFAAPNALYRHGMGGVLGRRFLQLTHVGRRSGAEHTVVLEVVRYDRDTGEAVVISGFGEGAQWLRNLRANEDARISFGRAPRRAKVRFLEPDEAVDVMTGYERRYGILRPLLRRTLTLLVGFEYRGTDEDRRRLVERLPLVAFRPA
ncbi:nitroreductase family deazaflavin-dependent oxidoreductase [Promicromonospora sp. NPDC060204]|uniref:nitroreductase family deazaflavin-dependent oxidoreductase n=1 Tax=Promicromonospora sp. NPDC060204 TaxID=3347071 RepID=UPI003649DAD6